jgi:archaellin
MTGGDMRAQSGMDRLALFVLVVLVIVAATPFVLNFVGIDVRAPPDVAVDEEDELPKLVVLSAEGTSIMEGDQSVGAVEMVVTRSPNDQPLDLSAVTVSWSNGGAYTLAHVDGAGQGADGEFAASLVRAGRTGHSLTETGDRALLTFDLGTDDVGGIREFGSRLRPGESVTVRFETADGRVTTTNLTVPDPLPGGGSVGL